MHSIYRPLGFNGFMTQPSQPTSPHDLPATLGALKATDAYRPKLIKQEVRDNLVARLHEGARLEQLFPGLIGYEESVLPQVVNALLAQHDILLLGLRGQAKTRLARSLVTLFDPWTPVIQGDPLRSHPLAPIGPEAAAILQQHGDETPLEWLSPDDRYGEKLATPDVAVSDLIGDIDPIRAQREGFDLGDLRSVTFGIVPRSNRGVFCINELPDLAPRIQVALFNILEEQDVQVRGIPLRLPLDLLLIFTANPEDYTSRGQIITPLKDRIGAQIFTHYPKQRQQGVDIIEQEAEKLGDAQCQPHVPSLFMQLIEEVARSARVSEFVDQSSGVSARLTISAYEALQANVWQRGLMHGDAKPSARLVDLPAVLSALTGKIELAYEGEQEGAIGVGWHVLGKAVTSVWQEYLPPVIDEDGVEDERDGIWQPVLAWFAEGNRLELNDRASDADHAAALAEIPQLAALTQTHLKPAPGEELLWQEFVIEGLFQQGVLAREDSQRGLAYADLLSEMLRRKS